MKARMVWGALVPSTVKNGMDSFIAFPSKEKAVSAIDRAGNGKLVRGMIVR